MHRQTITPRSFTILLFPFLIGLVVLLFLTNCTRAPQTGDSTPASPTPTPLLADIDLSWETPPDQRIVYFVAQGAVPADSYMAPALLERVLGVHTVHSWDDVIRLHDDTPLDALIVHESAAPVVDREWMATTYPRGLVVAGFNLWFDDLGDMTSDPCLTKTPTHDAASAPADNTPYFTIAHLSIDAPPDAIDSLMNNYRKDCHIEPPADLYVASSFGSSSGSATELLATARHFQIFAQSLVRDSEGIETSRTQIGQQVTATAGPTSTSAADLPSPTTVPITDTAVPAITTATPRPVATATEVPLSTTPADDTPVEREGMILRKADTPVPRPTATLPPFECLDDTPIETEPPAGALRVIYELDGKTWEWRKEIGEATLLFDPTELPDDIIDHALSHDGQYVAFARQPDETTFELWIGDVETGSRRRVAMLTTDKVLARYPEALDVDLIFEWVRDSHTLQYELKPELDIGPATLSVHQTTHLVNAETGRTRTIFPPAEITNVTYSPDLTQIAAMAGEDQELRLIDVATGEVQHVIPLPLGRASRQQTMRYSPDGQMLAAFTTDGVSLIDTDESTHRDILLAYDPIGISHYSAWPHMIWSPDSRFFYVGIAADDDFTEVSAPEATYTIWRIDVAEATAEPVNEFYGFFGSYFSPDLRYLAAWQWNRGDGNVHDLFLSDVTEGRQMFYDRGRLLFLDGWNANGVQFLYTVRDTGEVMLGHVCDEPQVLEAISPARSAEWVDSQRILALGNLRGQISHPLYLYTLAGERTHITTLRGSEPQYYFYFEE